MRKNKNTSKIILATMAALVAMLVSYTVLNDMSSKLKEKEQLITLMQKTQDGDMKDSYTYAVATKDLKAGEIVSDEDVDFKEFDSKSAGNFENRSDVINKVLLNDIKSGDAYSDIHIARVSQDDVTLKDGYRSLTLPSESFQGKSKKMSAGSVVDIYSASSSQNWSIDGVRIISLEAKGDKKSAPTDVTNASAITFEVPADEIIDFISNASKNKLVLVSSNAHDAVASSKKKKVAKSSFNSGYNAPNYPSLPNLPANVPIENMSGLSGLSGLPQPVQPEIQPIQVELIEANVKTKVTFD